MWCEKSQGDDGSRRRDTVILKNLKPRLCVSISNQDLRTTSGYWKLAVEAVNGGEATHCRTKEESRVHFYPDYGNI